jgi:cation transport regulator ChaC
LIPRRSTLAFVANTRSERYIARPDEATAARYLRKGRGALGSFAAYLDKTVQDLRAWGLYDRRLERLHRRVFAQTVPIE